MPRKAYKLCFRRRPGRPTSRSTASITRLEATAGSGASAASFMTRMNAKRPWESASSTEARWRCRGGMKWDSRYHNLRTHNSPYGKRTTVSFSTHFGGESLRPHTSSPTLTRIPFPLVVRLCPASIRSTSRPPSSAASDYFIPIRPAIDSLNSSLLPALTSHSPLPALRRHSSGIRNSMALWGYAVHTHQKLWRTHVCGSRGCRSPPRTWRIAWLTPQWLDLFPTLPRRLGTKASFEIPNRESRPKTETFTSTPVDPSPRSTPPPRARLACQATKMSVASPPRRQGLPQEVLLLVSLPIALVVPLPVSPLVSHHLNVLRRCRKSTNTRRILCTLFRRPQQMRAWAGS